MKSKPKKVKKDYRNPHLLTSVEFDLEISGVIFLTSVELLFRDIDPELEEIIEFSSPESSRANRAAAWSFVWALNL